MRTALCIIWLAFGVGCGEKAATTEPALEGTVYGEGVTATLVVAPADLVARIEEFEGKRVRVEGLVTDVCAKRGCWFKLAGDENSAQTVTIKVTDGVIVFPMEAKGKRAVAEGEFTVIEMTMEQTLAYKKHHAEEHKEEFDPSTVTEPLTYYQINATGAVIL
jgi:cytochrome c-type biogenesis protein CcmE